MCISSTPNPSASPWKPHEACCTRQGFALRGWKRALKRPGGWINEICGAQPSQGTESLEAEMSRGFVTLVTRRFRRGLSSMWGFLSSIRSHGAWSCGRLQAQEVNVRAPPLRPRQMSSGYVCARPASLDALRGAGGGCKEQAWETVPWQLGGCERCRLTAYLGILLWVNRTPWVHPKSSRKMPHGTF